MCEPKFVGIIPLGNRTELSSTRSVIITSDKKDFEREARIQFVFTSNDYRQNWTTRSPITNLICCKNYNVRKRKKK